MRRFLTQLLLPVICILISSATGHAAGDRRIALVIGNSTYQHTAALENPRNDAGDMAAALERLGFEVIVGIDLDKRSMERTIRQFGVKLADADLALFFYAGHGLQVSGQNYLMPADARLSSEGDVDFESIPLHLVLKQMEREAKTGLLLLDACRDNPLARNLARTMGTRSSQVGQGLAEVRTGVGTLIGFSTQPGNVALDGTGRNSPYVAALLKHIEAPNKDIGATLINVRNDVVHATGGKQVPWEHTSLMHEIVLSRTTAPELGQPGYDKDMELAFWNAVKDSRSAEVLQTYLDRFPKGTFAGLARALMDQVAKEQTAERELARREDQLRRAEEARAAAERQQRDADRKAAESRLATELKGAQEDARKAREALSVAEKERETALKAAETARKAQEETRKAKEIAVASIPSLSDQAQTGLAEEAALIRSIHRELRRVGCDPGREDGKWGPGMTGALGKYNRLTKSALRTDGPTRDALAAIAGRKGRTCPLECGAGERADGGRCVVVTAPKKPRSSEVSRSPAKAKSKQSALDACIQCCGNFGPAVGGGGCASLCFSRDPRIESCLR